MLNGEKTGNKRSQNNYVYMFICRLTSEACFKCPLMLSVRKCDEKNVLFVDISNIRFRLVFSEKCYLMRALNQ